MMTTNSFSRSLEKNLDLLRERLHLDVNDDVVIRRFFALGQECALVYVEGLSDGEQMAQHVLRPMMNSPVFLAGKNAAREAATAVLYFRRSFPSRKSFRIRCIIKSG